MATTQKTTFSRRLVDHLTDELVIVLGDGGAYEFRALFAKVYEGMKLKKTATGGEEMLRLRTYEKLLLLAKRGRVLKSGKNFTALAGLQEESSTHKQACVELAAAAAAKSVKAA
jgi:hypothetical protein